MIKREELQKEWINKFILSNKRNVLHLCPRTGKTRVAINIMKKLNITDEKILISYPDNVIIDSWLKELEKTEYFPSNIIFCNTSSLKKYINEKDIYLWVIDECHEYSDKEMQYMKEISQNTEYILGLSGSLSKNTQKELKTELNLSALIDYSIEQAIEDGLISNYQITIHTVDLDKSKKTQNKKGKMQSEKEKYDAYSFMISKFQRENKDTMFLAIHRNNVLKNSYAKKLKTINLLKKLKDKRVIVFTGLKKVSEDLGIPFYHSTTKDDKIFNDFINGKINHMALVNMGGVGITYPELDTIIMSNFTYNTENTLQQLCRCLVLDYKEKIADLHIITSKEPAEIKKLQESLSIFDQNKIKWI